MYKYRKTFAIQPTIKEEDEEHEREYSGLPGLVETAATTSSDSEYSKIIKMMLPIGDPRQQRMVEVLKSINGFLRDDIDIQSQLKSLDSAQLQLFLSFIYVEASHKKPQFLSYNDKDGGENDPEIDDNLAIMQAYALMLQCVNYQIFGSNSWGDSFLNLKTALFEIIKIILGSCFTVKGLNSQVSRFQLSEDDICTPFNEQPDAFLLPLSIGAKSVLFARVKDDDGNIDGNWWYCYGLESDNEQ
ncbi:hypothetical protein ACR9GP_25355 [Enterobacter ludwigii]